jgi:anti-sigma factor RsiW
MSDNLKDILSNLNKDIEQDKLLDYLNKQLPADEAHEVEKQMADDPFMNDAIEGLSEFENTNNLSAYVQLLNIDLQKQLDKKKKRKAKRKFKDRPWVYFAIIFLLALLVVCYVVLKKKLDKNKGSQPVKISVVVVDNKALG